jgi:hypothetical protein
MKSSRLIWMLIQAAVFGAGMWMEFDMSGELHQEPNLVRGAFFGFIGAFTITVLWFDTLPRLIGWYRRMFSPARPIPRDVDAGPLSVFPAIGSDDGEAGGEREHLIAPPRRGGDGPKLIGSSRIGQKPR